MSTEKPPQMMRLSTSDAAIAQQQSADETSKFQVGSRYVLLILLWSSTPLAVVWSVREMHPVWVLSLRFAAASLLAYLICVLLRLHIRMDKQAVWSYLAGSLSLIGAMFLTYLAAPHLASGLISLLYGFSPLVAGVMALFFDRQHKLFAEQWLGMLVAVVGLGLICLTGEQQYVQAKGIILIGIALLCYVGSMFWVKAVGADIHPLVQTTGSLVISSAGMLLVLPFFWYAMPMHLPSMQGMLAIAYSIVMASIVAMLCYFDLVKRLSPSTVALTTILTPVLALFLGVMLNHEHLGANTFVGVVVILSGLILYFVRELYQQYWKKSGIKLP